MKINHITPGNTRQNIRGRVRVRLPPHAIKKLAESPIARVVRNLWSPGAAEAAFRSDASLRFWCTAPMMCRTVREGVGATQQGLTTASDVARRGAAPLIDSHHARIGKFAVFLAVRPPPSGRHHPGRRSRTRKIPAA